MKWHRGDAGQNSALDQQERLHQLAVVVERASAGPVAEQDAPLSFRGSRTGTARAATKADVLAGSTSVKRLDPTGRVDRLLQIEHSAHQRLLLSNASVESGLPLMRELLDRARSSRNSDPKETLRAARLALLAAELLKGGCDDVLCAQAWAEVGNALRMRSDFRGSEEALGKAETMSRLGEVEPAFRAQLWSFWASLRHDQRRLDESIDFSLMAVRLYERHSHFDGVARGLIKIASVLSRAGLHRQCLAAARGASRIALRLDDPDLTFLSIYNGICYQISAGEVAQAAALADRARPLLEWAATPRTRPRMHWSRGRLDAALGRLPAAREQLMRALEGFESQDQILETALISTDLAVVLSQLGDSSSVRTLQRRAAGLFEALGLPNELQRWSSDLSGVLGRAEAVRTELENLRH